MTYTQEELNGRVWAARHNAARDSRKDAVSEILAAAITTDDETAAEVMTGLAEHLARGFTVHEMDKVKAHAVEIALAKSTGRNDR